MSTQKEERPRRDLGTNLPSSPFQRFTDLTKRLLEVSKKELDEQRALYAAKKKQQPKRR